jgi:molybdopterin converting factor small subunit
MTENASKAKRPAAGDEAFTVKVEAIAWVRTFLGGPAEGAQVFDEQARAGETVRDVLAGLSRRYPKLHEALWDPNAPKEIGSHVEVIVNNTILGNDYDLNSPVSPGDEIVLTGQYIGG